MKQIIRESKMNYYLLPGLAQRRKYSSTNWGLLRSIIRIVCAKYGVTIADLKSRDRSGDVMSARHLANYLLMNFTGYSCTQIGNFFNRDHTSILHSRRKVVDLINTYEDWRQTVENITAKIRAGVTIKDVVSVSSLEHKGRERVKGVYSNTSPYGIAADYLNPKSI